MDSFNNALGLEAAVENVEDAWLYSNCLWNGEIGHLRRIVNGALVPTDRSGLLKSSDVLEREGFFVD